jgi:hypothetical protein
MWSFWDLVDVAIAMSAIEMVWRGWSFGRGIVMPMDGLSDRQAYRYMYMDGKTHVGCNESGVLKNNDAMDV